MWKIILAKLVDVISNKRNNSIRVAHNCKQPLDIKIISVCALIEWEQMAPKYLLLRCKLLLNCITSNPIMSRSFATNALVALNVLSFNRVSFDIKRTRGNDWKKGNRLNFVCIHFCTLFTPFVRRLYTRFEWNNCCNFARPGSYNSCTQLMAKQLLSAHSAGPFIGSRFECSVSTAFR